MSNKRVLQTAIKELDKRKAPPAPKDIITDPAGQWKFPGQVTRIPSSTITMQGVPYPVLGVPDNGAPVMMQPGQYYEFPEANYVDEYPQMKKGGAVPVIEDAGSFNAEGYWIPDWETMKKQARELNAKTVKTKNGAMIYFDDNWNVQSVDDNSQMKKGGGLKSKKYTRSLEGIGELFRESALFKKPKSKKKKFFNPNAKYFQDGGEPGDKFKKRLMKRNPGMQGVYGPEGENLNIVKDPNYDAGSKPYYAGDIEFMFPGLPQVSYKNKDDETLPDYVYKNPSPDKYTSVYNPRGANRADIFLDMLHGMRDDQNYEVLLQNFDKAVRDARGGDMQYYYEQDVANDNYTDGQEQWDDNYIDGQLRAQLAPGTLGMFSHGRRDYRKERRHDSPEMRAAAKDIKNYLKTPKEEYVEADLTPEEIQEYAKGGYIIEDIAEYQDGGPWNPDYEAPTTYEFAPLSPEEIAQRNFEQEQERLKQEIERQRQEEEKIKQEQKNWTPEQWAAYKKAEKLKAYQKALINEPEYFKEGIQFVTDWHNSPMYNQMVLNSYKGDQKSADYITKLRKQNIASIPDLKIINSRTTKYGEDAPAAWSFSNTGQIEVFPGGFGEGPNIYVHEGLHSSDRPRGSFKASGADYPSWMLYKDPRFPNENVWFNRTMPLSDQKYITQNRGANYKDSEEYKINLKEFPSYYVPLTDADIRKQLEADGLSIDDPDYNRYSNNLKNYRNRDIAEQAERDKEYWKTKGHDYISEPTEVRARLGEIRYNAQKANIYDPFVEKITPENYQKYIDTFRNNDDGTPLVPINDLRNQFTDEEIIWMLNNISKNDDSKEELNVAAKGGTPCPPGYAKVNGKCKKVQPFVTSDPEEYAYRKAAYDDSLYLVNKYNKVQPKANKRMSYSNALVGAYLKPYKSKRYLKPISGTSASYSGFSPAWHNFINQIDPGTINKYQFKNIPYARDMEENYFHSRAIATPFFVKGITLPGEKPFIYKDGVPRFKPPVQPVIFKEPVEPKQKKKPLEHKYPTSYKPVVNNTHQKPPEGKLMVGQEEVQQLDPNTGQVTTVINPIYEDAMMPMQTLSPARVNHTLQKFIGEPLPVTVQEEIPEEELLDEEIPEEEMYGEEEVDGEYVDAGRRRLFPDIYVDTHGRKLKYTTYRLRKPGHSGDLIKKKGVDYMYFPKIERGPSTHFWMDYKQEGGEYNIGDEVELTEAEVKRLRALGYTIEEA